MTSWDRVLPFLLVSPYRWALRCWVWYRSRSLVRVLRFVEVSATNEANPRPDGSHLTASIDGGVSSIECGTGLAAIPRAIV